MGQCSVTVIRYVFYRRILLKVILYLNNAWWLWEALEVCIPLKAACNLFTQYVLGDFYFIFQPGVQVTKTVEYIINLIC